MCKKIHSMSFCFSKSCSLLAVPNYNMSRILKVFSQNYFTKIRTNITFNFVSKVLHCKKVIRENTYLYDIRGQVADKELMGRNVLHLNSRT